MPSLSQDTLKMAASVTLATGAVLYTLHKLNKATHQTHSLHGSLINGALALTGAFVAYKAGSAALKGELPGVMLAAPVVALASAEGTVIKNHKPKSA